MSRARGWGLRSISFQAKLTAIAVNLKRIAAITGRKNPPDTAFIEAVTKLVAFFEQVFKIFADFRVPKIESA